MSLCGARSIPTARMVPRRAAARETRGAAGGAWLAMAASLSVREILRNFRKIRAFSHRHVKMVCAFQGLRLALADVASRFCPAGHLRNGGGGWRGVPAGRSDHPG